jgi:hypothetical protein
MSGNPTYRVYVSAKSLLPNVSPESVMCWSTIPMHGTPTRRSVECSAASSDDRKQGIVQLAGTYVGIWQSRLSGAGALALAVKVENGVLKANATITGSPSGYKGDSLAASNLKDMGDGVWSVEFAGEHSKLAANGIFKPGSFVGDFTYKYSSHRRPDRGQWVVKR